MSTAFRSCEACDNKIATPDPQLPSLAREARIRLGILDAHCTNPACTWCNRCPQQAVSDGLRGLPQQPGRWRAPAPPTEQKDA